MITFFFAVGAAGVGIYALYRVFQSVLAADRSQRLPTNWWLAGAGLLFVLVAILFENEYIKGALGSVSPVQTTSYVFNLKTFSSLSKEIGFALLIAFFISNGIERQAREKHEHAEQKAREEHERAIEAARADIARDVFHGVFGLQHDRGYVNMVIEHVLQRKVVRERYDVEMAVLPLSTEEEKALGVAPNRFVRVNCISEYCFLNISTTSLDFDIGFILAARGGLLRSFARVNSVSIDQKQLTKAEIDGAEGENGGEPTKKYVWKRHIAQDGRLHVLISSTILKEMSDNEVWRNMHPTIGGASFKLRMQIPGMKVGIRNVTAASLDSRYADLPGGEWAWTISAPILPNESVVIWWQTPEDSGEVTDSTPASKPAGA